MLALRLSYSVASVIPCMVATCSVDTQLGELSDRSRIIGLESPRVPNNSSDNSWPFLGFLAGGYQKCGPFDFE